MIDLIKAHPTVTLTILLCLVILGTVITLAVKATKENRRLEAELDELRGEWYYDNESFKD